MSDGFIVRRGGGTSLNFKVVGNPQPASPKENTLWVNTDTPINGWAFTATQPAGVNGVVWAQTAAESPLEFNALKKNAIQVYPKSIKQYINGAWTSVEAKIYQGGKWVSFWDGTLYNLGDECTDVTGGWELVADAGYTVSGIWAKNSVSILVGQKSNQVQFGSTARTKNFIDFSGKKTLSVHIAEYRGSGDKCQGYIRVYNENGSVVASATVFNGEVSATTNKQINIDISSLTGKHRVAVYTLQKNSSAKTVYIEFNKVWVT